MHEMHLRSHQLADEIRADPRLAAVGRVAIGYIELRCEYGMCIAHSRVQVWVVLHQISLHAESIHMHIQLKLKLKFKTAGLRHAEQNLSAHLEPLDPVPAAASHSMPATCGRRPGDVRGHHTCHRRMLRAQIRSLCSLACLRSRPAEPGLYRHRVAE